MPADSRQRRGGRGRRGRSGVFPLNRGSSPFGRSSTLALNKPGGTFGAGRPSGGGIGAAGADVVAQALAHLSGGPSVVGQPEIGPPPVPQAPPIDTGQHPASGAAPTPSFPTQPSSSPDLFSPPRTQAIMPPASAFPFFSPRPVAQPDTRRMRFF